METIPSATPSPDMPQPEEVIRRFCATYPPGVARRELWKWFVLALKDNPDGLGSDRTTELISFFADLKALLAAVYDLQEPTPPVETDTPLGILSEYHSKDFQELWALLICPPD